MRLLIIILLLCPSIALGITLQVNINGLNPVLTNSVMKDLTIKQSTKEPKLTADRIKNLYDLAGEQITDTMQAKGYYNSTIDKTLVEKDNNWIASFKINPGQPTTIKSISLIVVGPGKNDPNLQKYLQTPKLVPGKTIVHQQYEDTKEQILVDLNAQGYLRADFNQSVIEVDRKNHTAEIKFILDTGPQFLFGKVTFVDSRYPDSLLNRYIPFKTGQPYTIDKLIKFQNNLESSELFNKIRFDPLINESNPQDVVVPVTVRLEGKPRNRYSGSIGYGTDTGIRGSLGWLHRFASPAGHKLAANIYGSKIQNFAKLSYIIPGQYAATDKYIFGLAGVEEKFDDVYSRKAEVFGSKVIKRGKTESIYGLSYFTETFRLTSGAKNKNRKYLLPNSKWIWTDQHEAKQYDYGTILDLSFRGGLEAVASDNNVLQTEINAKHIIPITDPSRLILRANLGAVASNEFANMPPSLRFFTGGDTSVRGYAYNVLGPHAIPSNIDSDVIGGRYLFVLSIEYEHIVYEQISVVAFFDAGNASNKFMDQFGMSPGVGFRYNTPIGYFRFDIAKPLNIVTNKHWRVHFNFGTDF